MTTRDIKAAIKSYLNKIIRVEKVAMLHPGRCGSTVLGSMMNQNAKIFWCGEPFERLMEKDRALSKPEVIQIIKDSEAAKISRIFSFATKYPRDMHLSKDCINLEIPEYVNLLKGLGYNKFIVIDRSNHLKRAISMENGRISNQWHTTAEVKEVRKVMIDPSRLMVGFDYFLPLTEYFELLDREHMQVMHEVNQLDYLCLNYERDIETDPLKAYKSVSQFLNLEYTPPLIKLKKTNPFPVKQTLSNFEEIEGALKNTSYSWMLNE